MLERPHRWTEIGRWHGIDAELTLEFTEDGDGCLVTPTFRDRPRKRRPDRWPSPSTGSRSSASTPTCGGPRAWWRLEPV